jgi:hypothetical protein
MHICYYICLITHHSLQVRFELSTLPEHRIVVMRILKFVEPVTCVIQNYDGRIPFPREGECFTDDSFSPVG